jgi:hypothetical protein
MPYEKGDFAMSKPFQLRSLDSYAPRERMGLLRRGVVFSVGSALLLLIGLGGAVTGSGFDGRAVFLVVVGAVGLLFFAPLTIYVVREMSRLRNARDQSELPAAGTVATPAVSRNGHRAVKTGSIACLVSADEDGWRVSWIGEGSNEPPGFETPGSLTEVTGQAATAALALYEVGPKPPGAELAFAIYPWDYGKNGAIYDVSGGPGMFKAREFQGSEREVEAESLEGLVEAVRNEPGGDIAMLSWIRPFAELPAEWLQQ